MIGKQIKKARLLAGLSQKELGDLIGKGISTISEWESGKRSPDVELIPVLGNVLKVSQAFLLDITDDPYYKQNEVVPDKFPLYDEDYKLLNAYHAADSKTRSIVLSGTKKAPRDHSQGVIFSFHCQAVRLSRVSLPSPGFHPPGTWQDCTQMPHHSQTEQGSTVPLSIMRPQ